MTNIAIQTVETVNYVDSRVFCVTLGLNHSDWLTNTLKPNQALIEEAFGTLRFQNGYVSLRRGGKKETLYIDLTEDQAYLLIGFCRTTPEVVQARINLIKAFSEARQKLVELQTLTQKPSVYLPAWQAARHSAKEVHTAFQRACLTNGYPAKHVHDAITVRVTGMTAKQARELPLIGEDLTIGLDHQPSDDHLGQIGQVKLKFASYSKANESWQDRLNRAFWDCYPE
jgi:phage regulator Rha-like protein